jgi:hypothetical protein
MGSEERDSRASRGSTILSNGLPSHTLVPLLSPSRRQPSVGTWGQRQTYPQPRWCRSAPVSASGEERMGAVEMAAIVSGTAPFCALESAGLIARHSYDGALSRQWSPPGCSWSLCCSAGTATPPHEHAEGSSLRAKARAGDRPGRSIWTSDGHASRGRLPRFARRSRRWMSRRSCSTDAGRSGTRNLGGARSRGAEPRQDWRRRLARATRFWSVWPSDMDGSGDLDRSRELANASGESRLS